MQLLKFITGACCIFLLIYSGFSINASLEEFEFSKNIIINENFTKTKVIKKYFPQTKEKNFKKIRRKNNTDDAVDTLYLGYSKNPFGPSILWDESMRLNRSLDENYLKEMNEDYNKMITSHNKRQKRGVAHLFNMITCATRCNPLVYKGYGCYCGFLGSGRIVDGIDRCCRMHDICYSTMDCPGFLVYVIPYLWKCWRGKPLCAVDHLGYGGPYSCAARLCECDRALAMCLSRNRCPTGRALCTSSPFRLLQNIFL